MFSQVLFATSKETVGECVMGGGECVRWGGECVRGGPGRGWWCVTQPSRLHATDIPSLMSTVGEAKPERGGGGGGRGEGGKKRVKEPASQFGESPQEPSPKKQKVKPSLQTRVVVKLTPPPPPPPPGCRRRRWLATRWSALDSRCQRYVCATLPAQVQATPPSCSPLWTSSWGSSCMLLLVSPGPLSCSDS